MNNQILYERLRDLRERNHFTQAFVSSKLNIGRATYSNYERGKRTPSLDVIMDLASFYKVPFTYFLNSEIWISSPLRKNLPFCHSRLRNSS